MVDIILSFGVGLIVGWNFLAQPAWVKKYVDKFVEWVKSLFNK